MQTIHFHASSISGRVDREAGIIRGAAVITGDITAKGHDLEVDDTLLKQIIECGNAKGRVQVKLNHRDPQALQSICGYITGFRREANKVVADWHLLKTHEEYPRIMERAERMPECFGLSAAFAGPPKGEKGKDGKKYARCEELVAVDCVPLPAANPAGLFAAGAALTGKRRTRALEAVAAKVIQLAQRIDREKKRERELPAAVKAGLSASVSGAALGLIPAFRHGTSLRSLVKSVAAGAGAGAAIGGGGTAIGTAILGKPRENEGAPVTRRAAIGGAVAGLAGGAAAGVLAHRTRAGRRFLVRASKAWRPAQWARKSGVAGAATIGGAGGALIGGLHAADEGQQVDTIESLKKQRKRQSSLSEFADLRPRNNYGQFAPASASGVDPNSMASAYGGVVQEKQRRLAFIDRVTAARRRAFGPRFPEVQLAPAAAGAVSPSIPPAIVRSGEFIKRQLGGGSLLRKLNSLSPTIAFRRKDDDEPSLRSRVAKGALIAGAGAAGVVGGARLGISIGGFGKRYRGGPLKPGTVISVPSKGPVDRRLGIRHAAVVTGKNTVSHKGPAGIASEPLDRFTSRGARVHSEGIPEGLRSRQRAAKKDPEYCIGSNCEHHAHGISSGKARSPQLRGALAGAAAGAAIAGGTASAATKPQDDDERRRGRVRQFAARIVRGEIKL